MGMTQIKPYQCLKDSYYCWQIQPMANDNQVTFEVNFTCLQHIYLCLNCTVCFSIDMWMKDRTKCNTSTKKLLE